MTTIDVMAREVGTARPSAVSDDVTPERLAARLALIERHRRFVWDLARDAHVAAAQRYVRGKTHDLSNLVQIVELGAFALSERCAEEADVIEDLVRAARDAKQSLAELMAVARPDVTRVRGPAVGPVLARAVEDLQTAFDLEAHLAVEPTVTTALSADELAHLAIALILDSAGSGHVELDAHVRRIGGAPWLELVRGVERPPPGDEFDLVALEVLVARVHGELAHSERRGGGSELCVSLPAYAG